MARKAAIQAARKATSAIRRQDPEAYEHMLEDVFVLAAPQYVGHRSVRATVAHGEGGQSEVHLLSTSEGALKHVYDALTGGALVRGRRIEPPSEEDVQRWLTRGDAPPALPVHRPPTPAPLESLDESEPRSGARTVQPTDDESFVLVVRDGRRVVDQAGPFATITEAIEARDERGASGQIATVYDGGRVADYRGGRAAFSFGRTKWSRYGG